jgi:hypothetical protein
MKELPKSLKCQYVMLAMNRTVDGLEIGVWIQENDSRYSNRNGSPKVYFYSFQ